MSSEKILLKIEDLFTSNQNDSYESKYNSIDRRNQTISLSSPQGPSLELAPIIADLKALYTLNNN